MSQPPRVLTERDYRTLERLVHSTQRDIGSLRNRLNSIGMRRHQGGYMPPRAGGVPFINQSGETVPAYGCMRVTGGTTVSGSDYVTIAKPSTAFQRLYLVNRSVAVADLNSGLGSWLSDADWVLYDDANTPAYGESWGPVASSWEIAKYRYGFTIVGNPSGGTTDTVLATQHEVNGFIGKTDSAHAKSATGTISIYDGNRADTTDNMADVYNLFAAVATTKFVDVEWRGGVWYLTSAEC